MVVAYASRGASATWSRYELRRTVPSARGLGVEKLLTYTTGNFWKKILEIDSEYGGITDTCHFGESNVACVLIGQM